MTIVGAANNRLYVLACCCQNPDNRAIFPLTGAMTKKTVGNVQFLHKTDIHEYAEKNNRSLAYAEGYFAGASIRRRGEPLSKYALVGIDENCLGLRAGYFVRQLHANSSIALTDTMSTHVAEALQLLGGR